MSQSLATQIPRVSHATPMDHIRSVAEWIGGRKLLSSFLALLVIGAVVACRIVIKASEGQLSAPLERGKIIDAVYGIGTVTANRRLSFNPLIGNTVRRT